MIQGTSINLEAWSQAAIVGQFLVILISAIFAYRQLKHAVRSNQMAAVKELDHVTHSAAFLEAQEVVFTRVAEAMKDPEFRYQVCHFSEATEANRSLIAKASAVGNVYENLGRLIRHRLVDPELVLETWAPALNGDWNNLEGLIAVRRRVAGDIMWENFEALSVRAGEWLKQHHDATIPSRWRRTDMVDVYLAEDARYEASRKTSKEKC